jgi:hypothetical protein
MGDATDRGQGAFEASGMEGDHARFEPVEEVAFVGGQLRDGPDDLGESADVIEQRARLHRRRRALRLHHQLAEGGGLNAPMVRRRSRLGIRTCTASALRGRERAPPSGHAPQRRDLSRAQTSRA